MKRAFFFTTITTIVAGMVYLSALGAEPRSTVISSDAAPIGKSQPAANGTDLAKL